MQPQPLRGTRGRRGSCSTGSLGPFGMRRRCRRPPASFLFSFLSGAAPIRRAPQDKLVFIFYGACGSSETCHELAAKYWRVVRAAAHGTSDRLRQSSALADLGLFASVSQCASPPRLPNFGKLVAAAGCGAWARCKRSLWPSTHADQPWVDALRLWWTSAAKQIKQLSGPTHGAVGLTR